MKINDRDLYWVADAICRSFILAAVDEVWYRKLRDSRTMYSQVTVKQLLAHLHTVCTGLHEIEAITILPSMMSIYEDVDSISKYINVLEDTRKRSARASMSITDKQVMAIASRAFLASGNNKMDCRQWNKFLPDQRTWFV